MSADPPADGAPSPDAVDALAHPIRRRIIQYLLDTASGGYQLGMSLLVNEIARFKASHPDVAREAFQLGTVRKELEDRHLPRLEAADLLRHDQEDDRVILTETELTLQEHLNAADD